MKWASHDFYSEQISSFPDTKHQIQRWKKITFRNYKLESIFSQSNWFSISGKKELLTIKFLLLFKQIDLQGGKSKALFNWTNVFLNQKNESKRNKTNTITLKSELDWVIYHNVIRLCWQLKRGLGLKSPKVNEYKI